MFDSLPAVPPDPIFSLNDQFRADTRANKVNLTVGTFQDERGVTPILKCVKKAEELILAEEKNKSYLRMAGLAEFDLQTAQLLLGDESVAIEQGRYCTLQTPGGTGALRIVGEYLARLRQPHKLWIGTPTWANHENIFAQSGVEIATYDYLLPNKTELDFEAMIDALTRANEGDAFLFHTCCHNPSGVDLQIDQWEIVFGLLRERKLLPVFDCAYQGFKDSLEGDMFPVRRLTQLGVEFLICSSNSKNFGLYAERVGALTAVCTSPRNADLMSQYLQSLVRGIYSNPPKHGGCIVATILKTQELKELWQGEVAQMRDRIVATREQFAQGMSERLGSGIFDFIERQCGMFSFTGLTADQVNVLRDDFAVYLLRSGRVNVAGINAANLQQVCEAIAQVSQHVTKA